MKFLKKLALFALAVVVAAGIVAPRGALAATTTGTVGTSSWSYTDAGVLTVTGGTFSWSQMAAVAQAHPDVTAVKFAGTPVATGAWTDPDHPTYQWGAFHSLQSLASVTGALDTSQTTSFAGLFANCASLTTVECGSWNTSAATSLSNMFVGCSSLKSVDVAKWNVSSVTDLTYMFHGCSSLSSVDVSKWNVSNVTLVQAMFQNCKSLASIDLSAWNVASFANTVDMFENCTALANANLVGWNLASATSLRAMFANCASLGTVDMTGWSAPAVVDTANMFLNCTGALSVDVTGIPLSQVTNMKNMFGNAHVAKIVLGPDSVLSAAACLWSPSGIGYTGKWSSANAAAPAGLVTTAQILATDPAQRAGTWVAETYPYVTMYRLYNPNSGEHFYTSNTTERANLIKAGWKDEGLGWYAPKSSATRVYRLYSGTDHHYTTSLDEKNSLVKAGWKYEGIGWYSDDAKGTLLYRQYNPNVNPRASRNNSGSHNYTTSLTENNNLVKAGWRAEGIGWYGLAY